MSILSVHCQPAVSPLSAHCQRTCYHLQEEERLLQPMMKDEYIFDVTTRLEDEHRLQTTMTTINTPPTTPSKPTTPPTPSQMTPLLTPPLTPMRFDILFKRVSWHFPLVRLDKHLFVDVMFNQVGKFKREFIQRIFAVHNKII